MTLIAYVIAVVANPAVLLFPFVLIPITAVLFLVSWGMRRKLRDDTVEGSTSV